MAASPYDVNTIRHTKKGREIDISNRKDYNYFVSKSQMYILDLKDGKIHCQQAETELDIENANYKEHMKQLHKDVFGSSSPLKEIRSRTFADTVHHFQTTQTKKKVFCCNNDCFFLVKKSFTEGVQHIKEGETHTYKVIGKPLDIYISDKPLELKSLRTSYDESNMKRERINPGETKTLHSNTYYIVIAPCHTIFIKNEIRTPRDGNSTEISPSIATEDSQGTRIVENRNGLSSNKRTNQIDTRIVSVNEAQPSTSRADQYGNSTNSMELVSCEPEMEHNNASRGTKRSSTESERHTKKEKSRYALKNLHSQMQAVLTPPSPSSLRHEMEQISGSCSVNGSSADNCHRAVFAVRRDKNIESYALRPNSTFQVLQDSLMTGSFAIENEDMDPSVIEYYGEVQFIRELARFKNGSVFETTLTVQKDLLNELQDTTKKKEKVVVNYFFEVAFKTIEATYKRFSEMRNTKMIGSCVPAIVPLSDAKFFGAVPDIYETKP